MSALWSNATAGVWAGKLGGLGSDPKEGSSWCPCSACGRPSWVRKDALDAEIAARLCDRCYETRLMLAQPGNELYAAAPELADALLALCAGFNGDDVRLLAVGLFGSKVGPEIHEKCDRLKAAHEAARAALRKAGRLP